MNALLRNNMPIVLAASRSGPESRFRAKRSALSAPPGAPIAAFGWSRWNKLVQGLAFGAIK